MNDLIEYIEDLEMLNALDPVAREAHLEFLINKYKERFKKEEGDMERQLEMEGF
jgi:hypothetical protein|tara:strand:- start:1187 stop:1348 length:162 start_codon:yes stop_codon:yes gene_type:complete